MIIVFKQNATVEEKTKLKNQLESKGFQIHASDGVKCFTVLVLLGDTSALDINLLRVVEGVEKVCVCRSLSNVPTACSIPRTVLLMLQAESSVAKSCRLLQVPVP